MPKLDNYFGDRESISLVSGGCLDARKRIELARSSDGDQSPSCRPLPSECRENAKQGVFVEERFAGRIALVVMPAAGQGEEFGLEVGQNHVLGGFALSARFSLSL